MLEKIENLKNEEKYNAAAVLAENTAAHAEHNGDNELASEIYQIAADLYEKAEKIDKCLKCYKKAAVAYSRIGEPEETSDVVSQIFLTAGRIARRYNKPNEALSFFKNASDLIQDDVELIHINKKIIELMEEVIQQHIDNGRLDDAIKLLKKLAEKYEELKDYIQANKVWKSTIKLLYQKADIAVSRGKYDEGASALIDAGTILLKLDQDMRAAKEFQRAAEYYSHMSMHSKAGSVYEFLAELLDRNRQIQQAQIFLEKAALEFQKVDEVPEKQATLALRAAEIFERLNKVMKARWAYRHAAELFLTLAAKADSNQEDLIDEYKITAATCMLRSRMENEGRQILDELLNKYLVRAESSEDEGDFSEAALNYERAAKVSKIMGEDFQHYLEMARDLYLGLMQENMITENFEEAATMCSKAADTSEEINVEPSAEHLRKTAADLAMKAAKAYEKLCGAECASIWIRNAARELSKLNKPEALNKAYDLFLHSAKELMNIEGYSEALEDLYSALLIYLKTNRKLPSDHLNKLLSALEMNSTDQEIVELAEILQKILNQDKISALITVQENEDILKEKAEELAKYLKPKQNKRRRRTLLQV